MSGRITAQTKDPAKSSLGRERARPLFEPRPFAAPSRRVEVSSEATARPDLLKAYLQRRRIASVAGRLTSSSESSAASKPAAGIQVLRAPAQSSGPPAEAAGSQGVRDAVENRTGMPDPSKGGLELLSGLDQSTIQRAVGFEIEMNVAADISGKDAPEKVTHFKGGGVELTIDHNMQIAKLTKAIKNKAEKKLGKGNSPTDEYSSILEIVTPPAEIENSKDRVKALNYIKRAQSLAMTIFEGTDALRNRVPLAKILSTSSPLFVSADIARWEMPQLQSLDAHIQSSVGVDLAQVPDFLTEIQNLKRSFIPTGNESSVEENFSIEYVEVLDKAKQAGKTVADEIRGVMKGKFDVQLEAGQNLINLEGLLASMAIYLIGGGKAFFLQSNWKNFTPLLSRVDLGTVFNTSLTPNEREVFKDEDTKSHIASSLIAECGRNDSFPLIMKEIYGESSPKCGTFVDNIFSGKPDGIMAILKAQEEFKELGTESVGPGRGKGALTANAEYEYPKDFRRQAIIFETRVMKYKRSMLDKVDELQAGGLTTRYPFNSWYTMAAEIIDLVMRLNQTKFIFEKEIPEEEEARRWQEEWDEYMRSRDDDI